MNIAGLPVVIEGEGPETIVMIHGWPDTHQIWSQQARYFSKRYRCVRFTLPGFGEGVAVGNHSLTEVMETIRQIVDAVSPDRKVILMIHDWGCVFGYQFAMLHPDRVERVIAIDIGDANSPEFRKSLSLAAMGMVAAYQLTLALAWYSGKTVGNYITRALAKGLKAKAGSEQIHVGMNYPYAMRWMGANGGFDALLPVELSCPVFYAYGSKKPFLFHSPQWAEKLRSAPGDVIRKFDCGHWVMVDRADEFNAAVNNWLKDAKD